MPAADPLLPASPGVAGGDAFALVSAGVAPPPAARAVCAGIAKQSIALKANAAILGVMLVFPRECHAKGDEP